MLDLKYVVENREAVLAMLASRGQGIEDVQAFPGLAGVDPWALDTERRALIQEVEQLRHRQRTAGEEIARRGKAREDASDLKAEMKGVAERIKAGEARLAEVKQAIERFLMVVPNLPDASVPVGKDAADNRASWEGSFPDELLTIASCRLTPRDPFGAKKETYELTRNAYSVHLRATFSSTGRPYPYSSSHATASVSPLSRLPLRPTLLCT